MDRENEIESGLDEARIEGQNESASEPKKLEDLITEQLLANKFVTAAQEKTARRIKQKLPTEKSLLAIFQELEIVDQAQILKALRKVKVRSNLGDLLVELGYIKEIDLRNALNIQQQKTPDKNLGRVLIDNHFLSEDLLLDVLSIQLRIPKIDPEFSRIDKKLLAEVNPKWCRELNLIPIGYVKDRVVLACIDPMQDAIKQKAREVFGDKVLLGIANSKSLSETITVFEQYRKNQKSPVQQVSGNNATAIVDKILIEAIETGASDVHFVPLKNHMRVRFRSDGVMMPQSIIENDQVISVIGRLKVMSGADVSEKRHHQDGRILFENPVTGQNVDMRASFYVTVYGEKLVLRVLSNKVEMLSVDQLGLTPRATDSFYQDVLDTPSGIILITGPTGSGKTTTLYSCINYLNSIDRSIITAEDPVEYQVEGISQCSLNSKIGMDYKSTLPAMVRQDPDVIVLGEIRDNFSAEAAIQAALTGHKVLTTFHTEDTIGSLLRLMNMNIETFLISSTLVSVLAQRLLRKICPECAEPYTPTSAELNRIGFTKADFSEENLLFGKGCEKCHYSGYTGRIGVYELLVLNEQVKDAILRNTSSYEIRRISFQTSEMTTLLEEGLLKAASGQTTLHEVIRHLPRMEKPRPLNELRRITGIR